MPQRDSFLNTLLVAAVLCVVCSLAVSSAAVILRPRQEANELLDQQKNVLDATGLAMGEYGVPPSSLSRSQIEELNSWISSELVDLETGEIIEGGDAASYNMSEALSDSERSVAITDPEYDIGEPRRPKVMRVSFVKQPGSEKIQQVVLPVFGKGLWGTLYGYLAVKSDMETIQGITFYQHKETPGLGGEVDNPNWKRQWEGKKLYDDGEPAAEVKKGPADKSDPYAVDGLSGATITSRGVQALLRYWSSDDGYGPFLRNMAEKLDVEETGA